MISIMDTSLHSVQLSCMGQQSAWYADHNRHETSLAQESAEVFR